jgi:hypothetical protein
MPVVHALMSAVCIKFQIFHTWLCTLVAYSHWWAFHTWILLLHLWGWQRDWRVSFPTLPVLQKWLTRWHYGFTGDWSIQKAPIKIVAVHIWSHVISTCVTLWLLRNYISYRQLKVYTARFLSNVDTCITFKKTLTAIWVAWPLFTI